MNELRFDGRVAIVTGAGSGMGHAAAVLLAQRGATVVVNCRPTNTAGAEETVKEIESFGGKAIVIPALIGVDDDAKRLVAETIETFGRIDIIYNNGGSAANGGLTGDKALPGFVMEQPNDLLDIIFNSHIRGSMQLNRAAWPHMVRQQYGRILFTGSSTALGYCKRKDPGPEGAYSVTKAAVFALCRNTAMAGAPYNIKANMVMPMAYTKMVSRGFGEENDFAKWMKANIRPDQVAKSVLPLLHEDCPCYGEAISSYGGRISRVFFAETMGYFNPDLTPEDALENWNVIMGSTDEAGRMQNVYETTEPRQEAVTQAFLTHKESPEDIQNMLDSVDWVAELPLKSQR